MMKKILIGMAAMAILGAIASAGYQTGKFLAQRDQAVQTPKNG